MDPRHHCRRRPAHEDRSNETERKETEKERKVIQRYEAKIVEREKKEEETEEAEREEGESVHRECEEEEYEEECEEEEWKEAQRLPLGVRLCGVATAAVAVGIALLCAAAWAYAVAEGPLPMAPHDVAVRAEHAAQGAATVGGGAAVTLLWEAAACGTATHYRVQRHNPLLSTWIPLAASPTAALGVRDTALPAWGGGGALVHYRIAGEDGVRRRRGHAASASFRIAGPGTGGAGAVFWAATSHRAPAPPEALQLADVSRHAEARQLLLQWQAGPRMAHEHGPAPLGYAVFVWSFASARWEEVERFDGFRRHLHYDVRGAGRHCFVVKAQAWGAVGWSGPSRPLCIFVEAWAYERAALAVVTSFPAAGAAVPLLEGRLPPSATAAAAADATTPPVEFFATVAADAFADAAQPVALV